MQALKNEIQLDPLGLGYAPLVASGDDGAISAILNAPNYTILKQRLVSARGVLGEYAGGPLEAADVLDKLEQTAAVNKVVKWAFGFLKGDGLDIGSPATQAMLDQLAAQNVLTAAEAANLKSMGFVPASRAEVLGIGSVSTQMVAEARAA